MKKEDRKNFMELVAPAFPPQLVANKLGGIAVPVPGMNKLEYTAIQLLPYYLNLVTEVGQLIWKGEKVTPWEAAIKSAVELIHNCNIEVSNLERSLGGNELHLNDGNE